MPNVTALPSSGATFLDVRDGDRAMRVSWHQHDDLFVLSLWRGRTCAATFQLDRPAAADLINALVTGLAQ
jgi:hypothetical protein